MTPISRELWVATGAISAAVSVILGAFAAHALKDRLSEKAFSIFQTAVHYQMFHAVGLILWGLWLREHSAGGAAGWLFLVGTIFFSGSLYILALTDLRWMGAITPLGGICFIVGWVVFAVQSWGGRN